MKVTENSEEIIIRHVPIGKWITGGILASVFGVFGIWVLYFGIINPHGYFDGYNDWLSILLVSAYVAVILIAVFEISMISMICAPLITVSINREMKSVDIVRQRFYNNKKERFYFHQVEKFKSYKGKVNFSSRYFLALVLANQKTIKLKIPIGGDKQNTVKLIKRLNKFIKSKRLSEEQ